MRRSGQVRCCLILTVASLFLKTPGVLVMNMTRVYQVTIDFSKLEDLKEIQRVKGKCAEVLAQLEEDLRHYLEVSLKKEFLWLKHLEVGVEGIEASVVNLRPPGYPVQVARRVPQREELV